MSKQAIEKSSLTMHMATLRAMQEQTTWSPLATMTHMFPLPVAIGHEAVHDPRLGEVVIRATVEVGEELVVVDVDVEVHGLLHTDDGGGVEGDNRGDRWFLAWRCLVRLLSSPVIGGVVNQEVGGLKEQALAPMAPHLGLITVEAQPRWRNDRCGAESTKSSCCWAVAAAQGRPRCTGSGKGASASWGRARCCTGASRMICPGQVHRHVQFLGCPEFGVFSWMCSESPPTNKSVFWRGSRLGLCHTRALKCSR